MDSTPIQQALIEAGFVAAPLITPERRGYMTRSAEQVKEEFKHKGISIASWAASNGFSYNLVLEVLAGRKKGIRGQAHKIMVKLGMKEGEIVADNQIANSISRHVA